MGLSDLKRMTTPRTEPKRNETSNNTAYRSGGGGPAPTDPKTRNAALHRSPKSPIEVALDRADARKIADRAAVTMKDVERMRAQAQEADEELRIRLAEMNKTATDLTRRLDYTYYGLLEKVGNLVATAQNFQSLNRQTAGLMENFEKESRVLEADIRRRTRNFREGFRAREAREDLERRGFRAKARATDLSVRLDAAKLVVEEWERREVVGLMRWGRFCRTLGYCFTVMIVVVLVAVAIKEWRGVGDPVRIGLGIPRVGHANQSLGLDKNVLREIDVPDDVREVLSGIEERQWRIRRQDTAKGGKPSREGDEKDKRLRALGEL